VIFSEEDRFHHLAKAASSLAFPCFLSSWTSRGLSFSRSSQSSSHDSFTPELPLLKAIVVIFDFLNRKWSALQ